MKLLFGGFIAVILLGLYEYAVYEGIMVVTCASAPGCTKYSVDDFTAGFSHAMSLIGGLVSALVIAELAVTKPGEAPVARALGGAAANSKLSWTFGRNHDLFIGLGAYRCGRLRCWHYVVSSQTPAAHRSRAGVAWTRVAAAYAYFGISPASTAGANH